MGQNQNIRVVLADDYSIVREGLRSLLDEGEIEVVGEATNGEELLALLEHTPADVVLLDISMPVMDWFEAARLVRERHPGTKVLALSMLNKVPFVQKMMACGAAGYLLKTTRKEELRTAIRLVAGGAPFVGADLAIGLLHKSTAAGQKDAASPCPNPASLSGWEIKVLGLIAEGYTSEQMAEKLFISKRTIDAHRQKIIEKTGARNMASLVRYAIKNGYVSIELKVDGNYEEKGWL